MDIEEAKRRAKKGPRILLARRLATLVVTFVSTVTVARLISPRDYGLANMSVVLMAFAQVFRDFGVTNAVLRKGTIDQAELSMIFWFNVAMTTLMTGIIALAAPAASTFYHEPAVKWIILVSLIGFQVGGVALQHRALINRELRFSTSALIDIASMIAGFVTTLTIAFIRRDVWAIVIGNIVQSVVGAILSIAFSGWRPGRPKWSSELPDLLRFGANSSVFSLSVFLSNNAASIIIGHFLGSASLGQYNRAQVLFQLPNANLIRPITQATMPLLTRLRAHPEEYRIAYLGLVRKLCVFLIPLSFTLMFAAVPLTEALLGTRWHQAGLVLAALAPALGAMSLAYSIGDLFVTQNRSSELRNLGLVELVVRVGATGAGVMFGIVSSAIAFTVSTLLVVLIRVIVAGRTGPVSATDQFRSAAPALAPTVGAFGMSFLVWQLVPDHLLMPKAVATLAAGCIGALATGLPFHSSRIAIGELLEVVAGQKMINRLRLNR